MSLLFDESAALQRLLINIAREANGILLVLDREDSGQEAQWHGACGLDVIHQVPGPDWTQRDQQILEELQKWAWLWS